MNIDLNIFRNSIGRKLKFCTHYKENDLVFDEDFHAKLLAVDKDYIIVEQTFVRSNEAFEEQLMIQKRKLLRGMFTIDTGEVKLSH
jgi:hypothetical protein